MATLVETESVLVARCTALAAKELAGLRLHPKYRDLLRRLQQVPGTIYSVDVEYTFAAVRGGSNTWRGFGDV